MKYQTAQNLRNAQRKEAQGIEQIEVIEFTELPKPIPIASGGEVSRKPQAELKAPAAPSALLRFFQKVYADAPEFSLWELVCSFLLLIGTVFKLIAALVLFILVHLCVGFGLAASFFWRNTFIKPSDNTPDNSPPAQTTNSTGGDTINITINKNTYN